MIEEHLIAIQGFIALIFSYSYQWTSKTRSTYMFKAPWQSQGTLFPILVRHAGLEFFELNLNFPPFFDVVWKQFFSYLPAQKTREIRNSLPWRQIFFFHSARVLPSWLLKCRLFLPCPHWVKCWKSVHPPEKKCIENQVRREFSNRWILNFYLWKRQKKKFFCVHDFLKVLQRKLMWPLVQFLASMCVWNH